jgi:hypothetical protein
MTSRRRHHQDRHLKIRSVRRDPPDLRKIASALIALAMAQNEADAQAEHDGKTTNKDSSRQKRDGAPHQKGAA